MISIHTSIRNIIMILLVFLGTIFFLHAYVLNIMPIIDLGYVSLDELYLLNFIQLSIIGFCVIVMVKSRSLVYRGKVLGIRSTAFHVFFNTVKIIFCIALAYCFFYYSITFG